MSCSLTSVARLSRSILKISYTSPENTDPQVKEFWSGRIGS